VHKDLASAFEKNLIAFDNYQNLVPPIEKAISMGAIKPKKQKPETIKLL